ncbi:uncharacterized protein LOC133336450 isoform X1 [Musca vetustissima]|uniref:uncharacterized protein LOC133336450 isoform X1 n=1 Tax=Musca vetustissima TaxID=27455 RepID=UPI002AB70E70|nr:uncharacterized protein LOC133336450 isoform X1 [Musca vetustissima]
MNGYTDITKLDTRSCLRRIARHDELQFSKDSIVNVMEKFVKTVNVMDETILVPCRLMDRQVGDSTDIIPTPGKDVTSNQHTLLPNANGKRKNVNSKNVHEFLHSSELSNLYNVLNALKNDLLWTGKDDSEDDLDEQMNSCLHISETSKTENICNAAAAANASNSTSSKGHNRRPSTASMASIASVSQLSDSESDISNENDSGVESESNKNGSDANSSSSSEDGHVQKKSANVDKATELAKRCRRHLNGLYQCLEQMTEAANYLTARYQSDIGGSV